MARFWTTKEVALLKEHYGEKGAQWIQKRLPHRSRDAIYAKVKNLGLSTWWSPADEELLRKLYPKQGTRGLVALLGKDLGTIRNKANRLGLRFIGYQGRGWTKTEVSILKSEYPTGGIPVLRELLPNRSRMAIYIKARDMGLKSIHGRGRRSVEQRKAA